MRIEGRTLKLGALAVVVGALAVGGAALAADDKSEAGDLARLATALRAKDAFTDAVAKNLGTSAAALRLAVVDAAGDRIDAAKADGSLSSADAETIRDALTDDQRLALRVAAGADVAKKLGVSEAKLDEAWNDALGAQALARVDQAVKDGWITEKTAEQLRERINATTFPGFGSGGGHGFGRGPGGHGHGFGRDFGGPGLGGEGFLVPGGEAPTSGVVQSGGVPV